MTNRKTFRVAYRAVRDGKSSADTRLEVQMATGVSGHAACCAMLDAQRAFHARERNSTPVTDAENRKRWRQREAAARKVRRVWAHTLSHGWPRA